MLRTLVRRAHIHKQGFKFPDRKAAKVDSHVPHPHPAAPTKVVESFSHFQEVFESGPHFDPEKIQSSSASSKASPSSSSSSSGSGLIQVDMKGREVAEDVHLLPERFWKTPALMFSDEEMDAVMSGGAR